MNHVNRVGRRLLLLLFCAFGSSFVTEAVEALPALPKPYVIVEAWHDREYCSDIYAYDFDGKLLRRFTDKPLPSCSLQAVSADGGQITFVANASALYDLNVRWNSLLPLHAGNAGPVTMSHDGRGIAYVASGFEKSAELLLRVQPLVAGAPFKRIEVVLPEKPTEIVLAPEGRQVLLTVWSDDHASIACCDFDGARGIEPFLSDPKISYYEPTFAPDGKTVAAISESLDTGEWAIVSKPWPNGDPVVLLKGPPGVPLSLPLFTADQQFLLFRQNGVLARMPAAGGKAIGLSGDLDNTPQPVTYRGNFDRITPSRAASTPLLVGRWFASLERGNPEGRVVIIDVRAGERKPLPLPKGKVFSAVVVE